MFMRALRSSAGLKHFDSLSKFFGSRTRSERRSNFSDQVKLTPVQQLPFHLLPRFVASGFENASDDRLRGVGVVEGAA
jgi:hypothetical protein